MRTGNPRGSLLGMIELPPRCSARYRVVRLLGAGGFGMVVLARDGDLDRDVVLKLLKKEDPEGDTARRFLTEAKITSQIVHENVVRLLDCDFEDGQSWIVYEYIDGPTLQQLLQKGPMNVKDAAFAALDIARGLGAAHTLQVFHRDVKPENVLQSPEGRYKLIDFGVAHWDTARGVATRTGIVFGTPAYMAPEYIRGEKYEARSDLYAVGVMLFQLVTGKLPYDDSSYPKCLMSHLESPIPSMRSHDPNIPAMFDAIVKRLMDKSVEKRHPDATHLAAELSLFLGIPSTASISLRNVLGDESSPMLSSSAHLATRPIPKEESGVRKLDPAPPPQPLVTSITRQVRARLIGPGWQLLLSPKVRWILGFGGFLAISLAVFLVRPVPGPRPATDPPVSVGSPASPGTPGEERSLPADVRRRIDAELDRMDTRATRALETRVQIGDRVTNIDGQHLGDENQRTIRMEVEDHLRTEGLLADLDRLGPPEEFVLVDRSLIARIRARRLLSWANLVGFREDNKLSLSEIPPDIVDFYHAKVPGRQDSKSWFFTQDFLKEATGILAKEADAPEEVREVTALCAMLYETARVMQAFEWRTDLQAKVERTFPEIAAQLEPMSRRQGVNGTLGELAHISWRLGFGTQVGKTHQDLDRWASRLLQELRASHQEITEEWIRDHFKFLPSISGTTRRP